MKNIPLRRYWDLLVDHLRVQRGRFVLLVRAAAEQHRLQVLNPQMMRYFIDTATIRQRELRRWCLVALAFIGVALCQQVVAVSATYVGENVAWTATNALRAELAAHCLRLDMSFHNEHSPGELIERIDGDVAELSNFFSQLVIRVIGNLLLMVGILIVLFAGRLAHRDRLYASLRSSPSHALNRVRSIAMPYDQALREAQADLFGFLEERLSGTEDIRSSGAVDFVLQGLYKLHTVDSAALAQGGEYARDGAAGGGDYADGGLCDCVRQRLPACIRSGAFTIGTVYLIVYYTNLMARPIRELTQQVESLQNIGAAIERLTELRAFTAEDHRWPRRSDPRRAAGAGLRRCDVFVCGRRAGAGRPEL